MELHIMQPEPLLVAFHKTKRAKTKIDHLNGLITAFLGSNPYRMVYHLNDDRTQQVWYYKLTESISLDIQIIAGEILHNLRSPLDQLCCAIADQAGRSENGVCFPCGRDAKAFKNSLRDQIKLPVDARDIIRKAEPYRGGKGHLLWALNELNRRDKHRIGLTAALLHTTMVQDVKVYDAQLIRLGSERGRHMLRGADGHLSQDDPLKQPIFRQIDGVSYIEFGPLADNPTYDDMEIATTFPGARLEIDAKPTFTVSFSKIGLDGQPIIAVLNDMSDLVESLLLSFESKFFS